MFGFVFHLVLALFLLALGVMSLISGHDLRLDMLPWKEGPLTWWVLGGALVGLLAVILAYTRKVRFLYPVWALIVAVLMIRGFFLSPYIFNGRNDFLYTVGLTLVAILVFVASVRELKSPERKRSLL
jgi:hypothetical protein